MIVLWRGYIAGRFYARPADGEEVVRLSPSFPIWSLPWQKRKPIDEDADALAALARLEADLLGQG